MLHGNVRTETTPKDWLSIVSSLLLCLSMANQAQAMRVASLNLCTDSMLFELAEPDQIASVTALSRDENLSHFAELAKRIPVNHGLAEEIVVLKPDLVLTGDYTASTAATLLKRLEFEVVSFKPATTIAEFRSEFRRLAALLGAETKAERLLKKMADRLANIRPIPGKARPSAIVYRPNGFSPGYQSLANEMLETLGIDNLARRFELPRGGFVPLERLVADAPDILILDHRRQLYPALADMIILHPAISQLTQSSAGITPVVQAEIPEKFWTCGGTYLAQAAQRLAALKLN